VTLQEFGLLLISIIASVSGQFFLKAGALKLGKVTVGNVVSHVLSILTTSELLAGLVCYGLGAIAYILLLTRVKLSIASPAIALTYVLAVMLGHLVFQEQIPSTRILGMAFIVFGVILVMWQR
jgi:uncharacterized membrane protein